MADKTIGELPAASAVYDDSLLVMEQQGEARSVRGAQIRRFVDDAAKPHVDEAESNANKAKDSAAAAAESARDAADVALHPPILKDENDHWWIWDTELNDYKDSGIDAGVSLDVVEEIITGGPGTPASVANLGTKTDPVLQFTIPQGDTGEPGFSPIVDVTKEGTTTTVTITDKAGEHTATIEDGQEGPQGPKGDTGRGFTIMGYYDTAEALEAAVQGPAAGDAYGVGTEKPYDIYIYDSEKGWVDNGPIGGGGMAELPPHVVVGEDSELEAVLPIDADTLEGYPASHFVSKDELETELEKKQDVLPYYSNDNILTNACFIGNYFPINQREKELYTEHGYTIDRWYINGQNTTARVDKDGIFVTTSADSSSWCQSIEDNIPAGSDVCVSVLAEEVQGNIGVYIQNYTAPWTTAFSAPLKNGLTTVSGKWLKDDVNKHTVSIIIWAGATAKIKAVKLELGTQQTLAHQDENGEWVLNEIPDYSMELLKCRRYYQVFKTSAKRPVEAEDFSPPMRIKPTLSTIDIGGTTYYTADANI